MRTYLMKIAHRPTGSARWGLGMIVAAAMLAMTANGGDPELPLDLGSAGDFVILAETGISTVPDSDITGDMGVSPIDHTAITGFSLIPLDADTEYSTSAQVKGKIYAVNYLVPTPAKMSTAISDMQTAYGVAAGRSDPDTTEFMGGDLSGQTMYPGLHKWSDGVMINTDMTLDARGNADAVFIFQIAGDLTMASSKSVILSGGAQAKNIFWQVAGGAGAVIGTYSHFEGVILTAKAITVDTGASVNGKLLAQTRVTLEQNKIIDASLIPPPQLILEIISEHGVADLPEGIYTNDFGMLLTNTVTGMETIGGTQYVNTGWTMTGNTPLAGTTNYMEMVHTNAAVLTWQWRTNYLLDASATVGGTITGDANGFYAAGSSVSVTAVPDLGYVFDGWTGDVGGAPGNATQTMTMEAARTLTAHFDPLPSMLSPSGGIDVMDRRTEFSWSAVDGATWYQLHIRRNGEAYLSPWRYNATTWTPAEDLPHGSYQWWVRGWNEGGFGPWSIPTAEFVISEMHPGSITLIAPTGVQAVHDLDFRWDKDAQATWYQLWVTHPGGGAWHNQWHAMTGTGEGSVALNNHPGGASDWWVRGWGPDGMGPWSATISFSTPIGDPAKPVLLSPAGAILPSRPLYQWNEALHAQWYWLVVHRETTQIISVWTQNRSVRPAVDLTRGNYRWWVGSWNDTTDTVIWSDVKRFSVE